MPIRSASAAAILMATAFVLGPGSLPSSLGARSNVAVFVAPPDVRIAELHYDNTGTDAGEAIEISAPAGTDLAGWSLVLYNGNGGAVYNTRALTGVVPASCETRGYRVLRD